MNYRYVKKMSKREFEAFLKTNPQLSRNFRLNEFLKSQTASRHGIKNVPNKEQFLNLYYLCRFVLQPIRSYYGRPVSISSGFRCLELNRLIGSADNSQHIQGKAVDFEIMGLDNYAVVRHVARVINFDQCILEYHYKNNPQSGWIHVSFDNDKSYQRNQVLTIDTHGVRIGIDPK